MDQVVMTVSEESTSSSDDMKLKAGKKKKGRQDERKS